MHTLYSGPSEVVRGATPGRDGQPRVGKGTPLRHPTRPLGLGSAGLGVSALSRVGPVAQA